MKNITQIIIKILTFPITAIKWVFYAVLTYILLFSLGFVIDRYVGWPPVIKPIRDSALTITIGIVKKITPPLQQLAKKFEGNEQHTIDTTKKKLNQPDNTSSNTLDSNNLSEEIQEQKTTSIKKTETSSHNLANIPMIEKLRESIHAMQASMKTMLKKNNTQHETSISPNLLYTFFTLNILFLLITSYLLYQVTQK